MRTNSGIRRVGMALLALVTAGSLALVASPASAADKPVDPPTGGGVVIQNGWGYVTQGNLRRDPNLNAQIIVTIYNQWVDIVCWIDGGYNGFGSNRWFKANYYAQSGYLSSGVVSSQPSVGHC